MDINITYRVLKHVLNYEIRQSGLNLTHTQDRYYIQVGALIDFHFDGLVQNCCNSSVLAIEILQPCTKPSIYFWKRELRNVLNDMFDRKIACVIIGISMHLTQTIILN